MDPLLEQFISESRDLIEEASAALLALESRPDDSAAVDRVFRSVHTIKGASGLLDVPALTEVIHAAEDLLDSLREGGSLDADLVDLLLVSLDQVSAWLDDLESNSCLPPDSPTRAAELSGRLRAWLREPDVPASSTTDRVNTEHGKTAAPPDWLAEFPESDRQNAVRMTLAESRQLLAVDYAPDPQCFFAGDDPIQVLREIPELQALRIEPVEPPPPLEETDAYRCILRFRFLTTAPREEIDPLFVYVSDQVHLHPVRPVDLIVPTGNTSTEEATHAAFVDDAMKAWESGDRDALVNNARVLMELSNPDTRLASALRWLLLTLDHPSAPGAWVSALLDSIRTDQPPDWSDYDPPEEPESSTADHTSFGPGVAPPAQAAEAGALAPEPRGRKALKVAQADVDTLGALAGELVVAKNALPYLVQRTIADYGVPDLAKEMKEQFNVIDRVARELQGAVMQVQMLPVSQIFGRFPRLVRDLSRKLGKDINLVMEGDDTRADKNIIEQLADPLIHLVRNSIDHGIETPEERHAAGKSSAGTLRIAAVQEGDHVGIEVSDDGRGIEPEAVAAKAKSKGIATESELSAMDPQQVLQLVFAPGLSTKEQASEVSGRGVGMDVVATSVQQVGGGIELDSWPGKGTSVRLSLPLSMAVSHVMEIEVANQPFGIPMGVVAETVRIASDRVQAIKHEEAFVLRDKIVPLHRLTRLLGLPEPAADSSADIAVLVVRHRGQRVGLVVDDFHEGVEVVQKPTEGLMTSLNVYNGTAILGNGRVLLILNVKELLACR